MTSFALGAGASYRISWGRALAFGALGGAMLVVMELLVLPFAPDSAEVRLVLVRIGPQWILTGIGIACLAVWCEGRTRPRTLVVAMMTYAFAMVLLFAAARAALQSYEAFDDRDVMAVFGSAGTAVPYDLWLILFFGGLFTVTCVMTFRAARIGGLLTQAEIERSLTETLLADAQISTLRAHVDPRFLLRVMTEVQRRYAVDPPDADRLINALVQFLRLAMPGLRTGGSTLDAEVALASAYAHVWHELEPARPTWSIDTSCGVPRIPFPPLWLLPVLDRLAQTPASARSDSARGTLRIGSAADGTVLTLAGPAAREPGWLPDELAYRLRVALGTRLDCRWTLFIEDDASLDAPCLTLVLAHATPTDAA